VDQRLRELLSDTAGKICPELQALHHNLANHERPMTVLGWLGKSNAQPACASSAPGHGR
jgi:hypothetical protein